MQTSLAPTAAAAANHHRPLWPLRLAAVLVGVAAWFWTQSLIAKRPLPAGLVGDNLHALTAPLNQYFLHHPAMADGLLIVSSAFIDLFALFLLLSSIFGPSIRPFLGLFLLFALRQLCQALCVLPQPDHMIWHNPGVPSLLVTYSVGNDYFFSGHTSVAVYGALELSRLRRRWLTVLGILIATFEAATVLILRAHYTMDVFTAAMTAVVVGMMAAKLAPALDRILTRPQTFGRQA